MSTTGVTSDLNRLELLSNISRDIVSELELHELLQRILRVAAEALNVNTGSILLVDAEKRVIDAVMLIQGEIVANVGARMTPLAREGLAGWVIRNRQSASVPNTAQDPRWLETETSANIGPRAVVSTPFLAAGRLLGTMTVSHDTPGYFNESDVELLESISDQAAIAVVNANLFEDSRQQARAMAAIAETARMLSATLNPEDVLHSLAVQVYKVLHVEATSIALVDPVSDDLVFRKAHGAGSNEIIGKKLAGREGIAGWVVKHGRGIIVPDVASDSRFNPKFDNVTGFKTKAALCTPIQVGGQTLGVIEALNPVFAPFEPADLQLLGSIADLAGTALAHAQEFTTTRAAEQHYAGLFEDSIDPILLSDLQGRITDANRKAVETFGYPRAFITKHTVNELHQLEEGELHTRLHEITSGREVAFEARALTARGGEIPVEIHAKRILSGDSELIQWIERDLSDRAAIEEMRTDLISMIFHDLRSPLGNIISSLDVMDISIPPDDESMRAVLRIAVRSSARLSRLVDSLLDLRRLEAGHSVLQKTEASVTAIIADGAEQVHPMAEGKDILLRFDLPSQVPTTQMDADMIRRVVINLMENAIKYTPNGGQMHVSATIGVNEIVVSIADTGPGIPEGEQARVFEKFARVQREGAPKGLGLGLAFCKMAVEAHGGRIWASGESGQGAVSE